MSWPVKYLSTIVITSETVFWSLFVGFQYLSTAGLGIIFFDLSNEHAKMSILLIVWAYVSHSGFYVSIDNKFFKVLFTYA